MRIRRIFLVLILLGVAGLALVQYLNRFVLPVRARRWAEQAASEALGRKVSVERVQVSLWHGFIIEGVRIEEDPHFGRQPILEADRISGGILFLPVLSRREVVIPALRVVRPRGRLIQDAQGRWNTQALGIQPAEPDPDPDPRLRGEGPAAGKGRFRLLIPRVILSDGRLEVISQKETAPISLHFQKIQAELGIGLPAQANWTVVGELQAVPPANISLEGRYHARERRFEIRSHSESSLPVILAHLPADLQAKLGSLDGTLALDLEADGRPAGPITLKGWAEVEDLRWETRHPISAGWEGEPPDRIRVGGNLHARAEGKIPPADGTPFWSGFSGSVHLDRLSVEPLPRVERLEGISGEIGFDGQGVRTEKITAALPGGTPVEMSGSVSLDSRRSFGLHLHTEFPLEKAPPLFSALPDRLRAWRVTGPVSVDAVASGELLPELSIQPKAAVVWRDGTWEPAPGWPARQAHGVFHWQPDLLTVVEAGGLLRERPLRLEGTLVNFAHPEVDARIQWGNLAAETQFTVHSDRIELQSLTGRIGKGRFQGLGEITWPEGRGEASSSRSRWPTGNLWVEAEFPLEELPDLWPEQLAWMREKALRGEVSARCLLQGSLRDPSERDLTGKISSPEMFFRDIPIQQLSADLRQEGQRLRLHSASGRVAQGRVQVEGSMDLAGPEKEKPWNGRISIQDAELSSLAELARWKTRGFSGQLDAQWEAGGRGTALPSLKGDGSLRISGAQVLELPLLGQFAEFLGLPTLQKIVFQEAQGQFRVSEGKVQTDSLQLKAPQATLNVQGWGGFLQGADSPIQWRIVPTFSPELIPEESRSKIGKVIARGASYLVGEVQISGTWKDPKRKFRSRPVTEMLNEQIFNLQDLFEEIF